MVARPTAAPGPTIRVADTLTAFGRLGQAVRERSAATVLAVTGSTGKTTTRDMLAGIMRLDRPTLSSVGSENNEIGVPRTLLQLTDAHEAVVLEFAMRGAGQIARLADMARPQIGIVTNVGLSHIGLLGSREAIAAAKAELIEALEPTGRAVLNADDPLVARMATQACCPVISYGLGEAQVRAESIQAAASSVSFRLDLAGERAEVVLPIPGRHNVYNALAAAAAAHVAGVKLETIRRGLETYEGMPMRARIARGQGGVTVLDDTYNASPDSVRAALDMLQELTTEGRGIAVLGPMLELGDFAADEHRAIGEAVAAAGVAVLVTVGELAAEIAYGAERAGQPAGTVHRTATNAEALAVLRETLSPGDAVLVKGSRAAAMEDIVRGLTE
jgi:UDP-N-acetylmuramoyl-tripeptide--D-alanyl-D-alanine ligase